MWGKMSRRNSKPKNIGWYRKSPESKVEHYWDGKRWNENPKYVEDSIAEVFPYAGRNNNFFKENAYFLTTVAFITTIICVFSIMKFSDVKNADQNAKLFTTATPLTTFSFEETGSVDAADVCKVPDGRQTQIQPKNVGFPLSVGEIPATGTANIIIMAVDFLDAPGTKDESAYLSEQAKQIQEWATYFSNGKLNFNIQTSTDWIHVPANSADYPIKWEVANGPNASYLLQRKMAQDIVDASGNQFDFTEVNGLLFLFPPSLQGVEKDLGGRNEPINTPQGQRNVFFWGGGQYHFQDTNGNLSAQLKREKTWSFWIHEMLHSQGLSQHAPGNGFQTGLTTDQYGKSFAIDAWESFLLGWISDESIFCADINHLTSSNVKLTPREISGNGTQAAIVRLNEFEALVVESRRPVGYSKEWPSDVSGLFVYRINTTQENDRSQECCGDTGNDPAYSKWGYYLLPDGQAVKSQNVKEAYESYVVKVGQTVTYNGVTIKLLHSDDYDFVSIVKG